MSRIANDDSQTGECRPACVDLHSRRTNNPTISQIFTDSPSTLADLRRLLSPSCDTGALLLISGEMAAGKTTIAKVVLEHLFDQRSNHDPVHVAHIGITEFRLPEGAIPRYIEDDQTCLNVDCLPEKIVIIDELISDRLAFEALALAQAGVKVFAILHARSSYDAITRLRARLREYGIGEVFLDNLISTGLLMSIHQEFV